ncbi:uncharacterized protein LOC106643217 [Copidosoma floridanum]|uniref:uncharacterized protein LOC106643217 n=1 Tax=Copidosoma floridanum TaxID=29053 RepID=UPI0006C94C61|nr:uncharacterized protein LOC106643217 [Copidosoma floridanum]
MNNMSAKIADEVQWPTTEVTLTPEEEGTLVTLVVVIVGVLAAIIFLFSMGIFIDYQTQNTSGSMASSSGKRKRMRLGMPPLGRSQRHQHRREDSKCFATDMCPNDDSINVVHPTTTTIDMAVV